MESKTDTERFGEYSLHSSLFTENLSCVVCASCHHWTEVVNRRQQRLERNADA